MHRIAKFRMVAAAALMASATGCVGVGDARYVYQDGQFGVVGIPTNTETWPHHYRRQADELMKAHFPEGYEIVRAEEVVEGSRTLVVDGKLSAEVAPVLPAPLAKVGSLGRTASRTQSDTLKIKECRIVYRRAEPGSDAEFAAEPDLTPTRYLDPNAPPRKDEATAMATARTDSQDTPSREARGR